MDLLHLCLTSTYFQYNTTSNYAEQHWAPLFPLLWLKWSCKNIEEQALATYSETLPLWLRYVDDTNTAVHKNKIDEFHEHLNKQNASIQFTREIEENGKIPFLELTGHLATREFRHQETTSPPTKQLTKAMQKPTAQS